MINSDQIGEIEQTAAKLQMQAEVLTNLWFDVQRLTRTLADIGLTMREAAEQIEMLLALLQEAQDKFDDDLR